MKIIAFSLWGKKAIYNVGAIRNTHLQPKVFPGWRCRFYCADDVPKKTTSELKRLGAEVVSVGQGRGFEGAFWRFRAAMDAEVMISRDTDSRLSEREAVAVDEWLKSKRKFHIMRDHPYHNVKILAGMWGCRNGIPDLKKLLKNWKDYSYKQCDQVFLDRYVWPRIKNDVLIHDDVMYPKLANTKKFPTKRINHHFVGEIFDSNDKRHPEHWKVFK